MINSVYNRPFPIIPVNDEFYLREHVESDTEDFFAYYTNPAVAKYILATNPRSLSEARAEVLYCNRLFQTKRGIYWTLARKSDNKMIGAVGFYMNNQHHRAEICYDLSEEYWRQGIMTKAIFAACKFAFKHIGVNRIEALTLPVNIPSIGVLKKLGFTEDTVLKNYRYFNNKSHDVLMLSITPKVFAQKVAELKAQNATEVA